jgi:short-subunit dehydrogenase
LDGIRHFVPAILRHGEEGHVVNTASVAGFQNRCGTNQGPYSTSKYAALSLSEALEHELEGTNVGVSVLCPGPVNTNIPRGARNRPDHMGGPQIRANEEAVLAERLATTGLDPKKVGERVVDAIRSKTFYDLCQRRSRRCHQGPASPHRGRPEKPVGYPLLRSSNDDRGQARSKPSGLDGGACEPLSFQRRR